MRRAACISPKRSRARDARVVWNAHAAIAVHTISYLDWYDPADMVESAVLIEATQGGSPRTHQRRGSEMHEPHRVRFFRPRTLRHRRTGRRHEPIRREHTVPDGSPLRLHRVPAP